MTEMGQQRREVKTEGKETRTTRFPAQIQRSMDRRSAQRVSSLTRTKTQMRGTPEKQIGYEIPWQHEAAIQVTSMLVRWQEKYNPLAKPQEWTTLHEMEMVRQGRTGQNARQDKICFLFRDLGGTYPNEPITSHRLRHYWTVLLYELERRVRERGETLANGQPHTVHRQQQSQQRH